MAGLSPLDTALLASFTGLLFLALLAGLVSTVRGGGPTLAATLRAGGRLGAVRGGFALAVVHLPAAVVAGAWCGTGGEVVLARVCPALLAWLVATLLQHAALPTLYRLRLTSVYEYLQLRYSSRLLRCVVSACWLLTVLLSLSWLALALAAPLLSLTGGPLWPGLAVLLSLLSCGAGLGQTAWLAVTAGTGMIAGAGALLVYMFYSRGLATVLPIVSNAVPGPGLTSLQTTAILITTASAGLGWQTSAQRLTAVRSLPAAHCALGLSTGLSLVAGTAACIARASPALLTLPPGLPGPLLAAGGLALLAAAQAAALSLATAVWEDFLTTADWTDRLSEARCGLVVRGLAAASLPLMAGLAGLQAAIPVLHTVAATAPLVLAGPLLATFSLGLLVPGVEKKVSFSNITFGQKM